MMVKCKKAGACLAGNCMHIVEHEQIDQCHDYRASMEGCGGTCEPVGVSIEKPARISSEYSTGVKSCPFCQEKDKRIEELDKMVETLHAEVNRLRTALSEAGGK